MSSKIEEALSWAKIILIGDLGVGKTNLNNVFANKKYNEYETVDRHVGSRVGSFQYTTVQLDGKSIRVYLHDLNGIELGNDPVHRKYKMIPDASLHRLYYYDHVHGAVILYDITKSRTFENVRKWLAEVREYNDENVVIMLIGTKCDILNKRQVPTEKAKSFADTNGLLFFEVSAKRGTNVDAALANMLTEICKRIKAGQLLFKKKVREIKAQEESGPKTTQTEEATRKNDEERVKSNKKKEDCSIM